MDRLAGHGVIIIEKIQFASDSDCRAVDNEVGCAKRCLCALALQSMMGSPQTHTSSANFAAVVAMADLTMLLSVEPVL